jgi:hypothetical protein
VVSLRIGSEPERMAAILRFILLDRLSLVFVGNTEGTHGAD